MPWSKEGVEEQPINSPDSIAAANKFLSGKLSIREAAKCYNISKTRLI